MEHSEKQTKTVSAGTPNHTDNPATLGSLKKISSLYAVSFLILAALIAGFVWYDLRAGYRDTLAHWNVQLSSSVDQWVGTGNLWLNERRTDTIAVAMSPWAARLLSAGGSQNKVVEIRQEMERGIAHMAAINGFLGGAVGDRDCRIAAQTGLRPEMAQGVREACQGVQQAGEYRVAAIGMEQGHVWISLSAPVIAEGRASSSAQIARRMIGSVVMVVEDWPDILRFFKPGNRPTRSSEGLLVWKKADEALVFSPDLLARGGESFFRRPLTGPTFESRVARDGDVAFNEFIDSRGQRVFGVARRIVVPGYSLAHKMDRKEALSEYRRHVVTDGLVGVLALLLLGSVLVALQRHAAAQGLEERVKQQQALLELKQHIEVSEARFRELVETAEAIVWETDAAAQRVTFVSQGAEKILGYTTDQWLQTPGFWADHLHPQDRPAALACEREVAEKGQPRWVEYRMKTADGRDLWFRDFMHAVSGPEGKVERLRGIMVDITESKRAEEELRASRQLLQATLDSLRDAVFILRSDNSEILDCNPAATEIFGYSREEMVGGQTRCLHASEAALHEFRVRLTDAVAEKGYLQQFEFQMRRKDGTVFPTSHSVAPLRDNQGDQTGWVSLVQDITERKRAEEALRESERRHRVLFESAGDGLLLMRGDRFVDCNQKALEMFGCGREQLVGTTPFAYSPPQQPNGADSQAAALERIKLALEGQTLHFEWRHRRWDGTPFEAEVTLNRLEIAGEAHLLALVRDVTEDRRTEEQLRKLSLAVEQSPATVVITDVQGKIEYVNRAFTQLTGYTAEEAIGQNPRILKSGLVPAATYQELWETVLSGGEWQGEIANRKKNGEIYWESNSIVPIRDSGGAITHLLALKVDISERKRTEEALRDSERRYRLLFEGNQAGVSLATLDGRLLDCNEALALMFGYESREDMLSQKVSNFYLDPADRRRLAEKLKKEGRLLGVEICCRKKDGTPVSALFSASFVPQNGEEPNLVQVTAIDISGLKRAEEERQRSLEQLRALAARLQSIREEERKSVAREIHDQLGQALTAIKIDMSSLIHDLPAAKKRGSESFLTLIDQTIQSVRRISTELRPGILDDLGLVAAVEWAGEEFEARTGTTCRLDLPQDDIAVDPEQATAIFRILQEALTNVARHAGASEVEVRLANEDGDLTLEVHDNGKGIAGDELSNGGSLGILGMRERAMLLGGELTISGPPGNGTTVRVRIPAARHNHQVQLK